MKTTTQTKIGKNFTLIKEKQVEIKKEIELKFIYFNLVFDKGKYTVWYSSEQELEDIYRLNEVNLENDYRLRLYGNIINGTNDKIITNDEIIGLDEIEYVRNKNILKSNIQKCIRRCLDNEAIISSIALIKMDFLSFIRRIIIISIEDVGIPTNLDFLVWLMVAYPNYEVSNRIIQVLLNLVYSLCKYKENYKFNSKLEYEKLNGLDKQFYKTPYITSLYIRKLFGGLKCDMDMIDNFIYHLHTGNELNIVKVSTGKIIILRNMIRTDIILESIDYHCYPELIYKIYNHIGRNITANKIQLLIWNKSSKINIRRNNEEYEDDDWLLIKDLLRDNQYNYRETLKLY